MATTQSQTSTSQSVGISAKYRDYLLVGLIAVAVLSFLWSAISQGGFDASDTIASLSFHPYLKDASAKGEFPLWLPYIFSGMPSYAALLTTGDRSWDFVSGIVFKIASGFGALFGNDVARIAFWYILYGIGMYFLMRSKKHERGIALFTALAAVFSTWVITWVMIGHYTKPIAFAMFPYVLMCLEKIREKWSLTFAVLLVVAIHIMIESTHIQMVFYGICTFGLYLLFELISRLITKQQPMGVVRAALVLVVAGGLSFAMASDRFLSTIEYTPFSTRGSAPISQLSSTPPEQKSSSNKQDVNGGNDYQYATNWSFSPQEMITFFVPNYYGYGKLRINNRLNPTYYGQMPFTDAANYMGIGVLMLGILGAWRYRRDVFVQFLIALSLFSLFLSFGKNGISAVYDFFYYYVPMFNKFRAPSMALAMMQFAMPLLAAYGIAAIIQLREEKEKKKKQIVNYVAGAAVLFLVVGIFYTSINETDFRADVAKSEQFKNESTETKSFVSNFVWEQMSSDWQVTGLIAVIFGAILLLMARGVINRSIFFPLLIVLLMIDLWRVDRRAMEVSKKPIEKEVFAETDMVRFLKSDTSMFRIADIQGFASPNVPAYHKLENIHGYHSAKMRVYQDLMDEAGKGNGSIIANPLLWRLLNVKYIVSSQNIGYPVAFTSQQTRATVYANPDMLPRAFFVNHAVVAKNTDILAHLKNEDFNPVDTCFVEEALPSAIEPAQAGATATITERKNEYMKLDVNATGNNLLFLSEIYYPISWKAYLDGNEIPIHKTNFAFRSMIIPQGKHVLELKFTSPKFEQGKTLSLAANIAVLLGAIGAVFLELRKKKSPDTTDAKS